MPGRGGGGGSWQRAWNAWNPHPLQTSSLPLCQAAQAAKQHRSSKWAAWGAPLEAVLGICRRWTARVWAPPGLVRAPDQALTLWPNAEAGASKLAQWSRSRPNCASRRACASPEPHPMSSHCIAGPGRCCRSVTGRPCWLPPGPSRAPRCALPVVLTSQLKTSEPTDRAVANGESTCESTSLRERTMVRMRTSTGNALE